MGSIAYLYLGRTIVPIRDIGRWVKVGSITYVGVTIIPKF